MLLLSRIFSRFPVAHLFYVLSNINLFAFFFLGLFSFFHFLFFLWSKGCLLFRFLDQLKIPTWIRCGVMKLKLNCQHLQCPNVVILRKDTGQGLGRWFQIRNGGTELWKNVVLRTLWGQKGNDKDRDFQSKRHLKPSRKPIWKSPSFLCIQGAERNSSCLATKGKPTRNDRPAQSQFIAENFPSCNKADCVV